MLIVVSDFKGALSFSEHLVSNSSHGEVQRLIQQGILVH